MLAYIPTAKIVVAIYSPSRSVFAGTSGIGHIIVLNIKQLITEKNKKNKGKEKRKRNEERERWREENMERDAEILSNTDKEQVLKYLDHNAVYNHMNHS